MQNREQPCAAANQQAADGSHVDGLGDGMDGTEEQGRVALVSVLLDGAGFAGRTRGKLDVPRVRAAVREVVRAARNRAATWTDGSRTILRRARAARSGASAESPTPSR